MKTQTVSILGCGWLGLPLGIYLVKKGYFVKGSSQTKKKLNILKKNGIDPYELSINKKQKLFLKNSSLFNCDCLIITLPFKRSFKEASTYLQQIKLITKTAESQKIPRLIFTSSTSIYPLTNQLVDETTQINPTNERQKILHEVEQHLLSLRWCQTSICRLGGLYGEDRMIGKFLSGKTNIKNPSAPVNLVHLDDAILVIEHIISKNLINEIFNVVSDKHPLKNELYTLAAKKLGIMAPSFSAEKTDGYKIVCNNKPYILTFCESKPLV